MEYAQYKQPLKQAVSVDNSVQYELLREMNSKAYPSQHPSPSTTTPEMQVHCPHCSTQQIIDATCNRFKCYSCSQTVRCKRAFTKFKCGHCAVSVLIDHRQAGQKEQYVVRCTKCRQVNRVAVSH